MSINSLKAIFGFEPRLTIRYKNELHKMTQRSISDFYLSLFCFYIAVMLGNENNSENIFYHMNSRPTKNVLRDERNIVRRHSPQKNHLSKLRHLSGQQQFNQRMINHRCAQINDIKGRYLLAFFSCFMGAFTFSGSHPIRFNVHKLNVFFCTSWLVKTE